MNEKNDEKSTTTENNNKNNKKKKRKNSPNVVVVTVDQNDNGDSRTSNPGSDDPEGGKIREKNNKESRVDDVGDNQKDLNNAQDCRNAKTKKEEEQNLDNNQIENDSSQKEDDEAGENQPNGDIDNEHQHLTNNKISKRNSREVVVVMTDGDCHPVTEVVTPDGDLSPLSPISLGPDGEEQSSRTTNPCIKVLKTISHRT